MDVESGEVRALPTSSEHVYGIAFTPDGRRVVSGGDGALRVWDREQGALLVTLWDTPPTEASPQGEWVTWTPEGYYDCSPGGEVHLRVRDSAGGLHPAGEYAYLFHDPERVQEALAR
jgi:WD40 repeat protein